VTVVDVLSIGLGVVYSGTVINTGYSNALNRALVRVLYLTDLFRVCS
jgi:hypothetical protein